MIGRRTLLETDYAQMSTDYRRVAAAMPGNMMDPIPIPEGFWERPDVLDALRLRRIGPVFKLLNKTVRSQTRIGIAVGMDQGMISRISAGLSEVEEFEVFERIADGLRMSDSARQALGLAPRAAIAVVVEHEPDIEPWELTDILTRSSTGTRAIAAMERATYNYAMAYPSTPPQELAPPVAKQLRALATALDRPQALSIRRRMIRLVGVLSGLRGNLYLDLDDTRRAEESFEVGIVAAEEAEGDDLMAWVLATRSIESFVVGDVRNASELLGEAQHFSTAGSSPRRQAWILAMYARSLAAQGDHGRALAVLESAYHLVGQAQTPHGTDFFDLPRLDGIAGTTYLLVRDTEQARPVLTTALGRRAPTDAKGRALITLDLARCAVIDGDEGEAHHLIERSLDIAEYSMVQPIASQIRQVKNTLRSLEGSSAGHEIDERLAEITASQERNGATRAMDYARKPPSLPK